MQSKEYIIQDLVEEWICDLESSCTIVIPNDIMIIKCKVYNKVYTNQAKIQANKMYCFHCPANGTPWHVRQ